jgi:hypothetical protein
VSLSRRLHSGFAENHDPHGSRLAPIRSEGVESLGRGPQIDQNQRLLGIRRVDRELPAAGFDDRLSQDVFDDIICCGDVRQGRVIAEQPACGASEFGIVMP